MKKMIAAILSLAFLISTIPATAVDVVKIGNEPVSVNTTEVNGVRTVKTSDTTAEYTVINDKNTHTITVIVKDLKTGKSSSASTMAGELVNLSSSLERALTVEQDTVNGFQYIVTTGTQNEWYLTRPKQEGEGEGRYYFKCWENDSNSRELAVFKTAVDNVATGEAVLLEVATRAVVVDLAAAIMTAFAATTGTLSSATIAAILTALELTGRTFVVAEVVATRCNTCMLAIDDVYYNTDNMHF